MLLFFMMISVLSACGGGGGSTDSGGGSNTDTITLTGYFSDSPVGGMNYETETLSGVTGEDGSYRFVFGETVTFKIGKLTIGETKGRETEIGPIDLVKEGDISDTKVVNIARLLQTLDEDSDPDNGISIPDTIGTAADCCTNIDFGSGFETGMRAFLDASNQPEKQIVSKGKAQLHMAENHTDLQNNSSWIKFASDGDHTIGLKSNGTVWRTGSGRYGQNGNNFEDLEFFSQVMELSGIQIVDIAAGYTASYAVDINGQTWGWGYDGYGELGTGNTNSYQTEPALINSLTNVVAIEAAYRHVIMRTADDQIYTQGRGEYGVLGTGDEENINIPVNIGLEGIVQIATNAHYTIALNKNGTVYGWGRVFELYYSEENSDSLDDNSKWLSPIVIINGMSGITKVVAYGEYVATLQASGHVSKFMFRNNNGVKVDEAKSQVATDATDIFATNNNLVVIKSDTTAWALGSGHSGILGDGTLNYTNDLVQVQKLYSVKFVSIGQNSMFSIAKWGKLNETDKVGAFGWGSGRYGKLSIENTWEVTTATPVKLQGDVVSASAGNEHTIALLDTGVPYTWGSNENNQLGIPGLTYSDTPIQMDIEDVKQVVAGNYFSGMLKSNGTVWIVGANWNGEHGNGTYNPSEIPVQVSGLNNIKYIAAGGNSIIAISEEGYVFGWGYGRYGKFCNGSEESVPSPVMLEELTNANITMIAVGNRHILALKSDGDVIACGDGERGQLGNGDTENALTPVPVSNLSNVTMISAGSYHSIAVDKDGHMHTWGSGASGQSGTSDNTDFSPVPIQIHGMSGIATVEAGPYSSFAVDVNDDPWGWGENNDGELGVEHTNTVYSPSQIFGAENVITISNGGNHTILVTKDGGLATGTNRVGELGIGSSGIIFTPTPITTQ